MYKTYQLALVTEGGLLSCTPFGIDDYDVEESPAEILMQNWDELYKVDNVADFEAAINTINAALFPDDEQGKIQLQEYPYTDGNPIDSTNGGDWYADYVFVKNLTEKPKDIVVATTDKKRTYILDGEEIVLLNLGEVFVTDADDLAKVKMIDALESFKENLGYNMNRNYSELWNMCADFDNENRGMYLTDTIQEADFVDEDLLGEYMKSQDLSDISRLRHFIGDTYPDYIYRFDGYGNLGNVDKDDFEEVVDNLLYELSQAIKPRYASKGMEM